MKFGETEYNIGVIAFKQGSAIIKDWAALKLLRMLTFTNFLCSITKYVGDLTNFFGDKMLESLFGHTLIEKVLFFLLKNDTVYPSQLSQVFDIPLFSCQKALERLEKGGIVASHLEGRTRLYQFNPRYPMLKELTLFLEKAYSFLPVEVRSKYYEALIRKRPRRKAKPL